MQRVFWKLTKPAVVFSIFVQKFRTFVHSLEISLRYLVKMLLTVCSYLNSFSLKFFLKKNLVFNEPGTTYCAHTSPPPHTLKMFVMKEVLEKESYDTKYLRITKY